MVAAPFFESFESLERDFGGTITATALEGQGSHGAPANEFAWGHTRFHVNKQDRSLVNCIGLYRDPGLVEAVGRSVKRFAGLGPFHLEAKRFDGTLSFQGSPLFRYMDPCNLLNPGRLAIDQASVDASAGAKIGASGWTYAGQKAAE
ncbi:MAG: hypothetical protein K2X46_02475 [Roseomonas sp.]|nr:hypothetical protein [Roseomonas sp.]